MTVRRCFVLLGALSLAACGQLSKGARQYFIDKYSCPAERVKLAEIQGTRPSEVFAADWRETAPPEEVKDDPPRLAQWRASEDVRRKSWESWIDSSRLFEVSGCGHRLVLACRKPGQQSSPGSTAICNEPPSSKG
ncbi:MAG TPA: hypothetical protein VN694_09530 [Caulobacteraceae bacterium]|nr:hypothetical protein [Caulobacteraceae bacterium]